MLAFAPPLSHSQSTEGPASTSAAVRSRPTLRPCTHAVASAPSLPIPTHHSNSIHRASSKRASKSSSTVSRPPLDEHRSEANSRDQPPVQRAAPHPQPAVLPSPHSQPPPPQLEDIHEQDPNKLLQLLASLLQHIASANDQIRSPASSSPSTSDSHPSSTDVTSPSPSSEHHTPIWRTLTSASRQAFSTPTSCLTFHARNIPTITLEAYLLRILKYCPTTNEVFLSLLVYFDRMSKLAFDATGKGFAIDSFNVHRLVIAGVTVASKFFSDVFYTNSRYAKVGGLPQSELNQLELQFLLLNDFRLSIASEEMQRYAEQLQIYSQNSESGKEGPQSPQPHTNPRDLISTSMRRMGAADAYGGRLHGEPMTESETVQETYGGVLGYQNAMELEQKTPEEDRRATIQRHTRGASLGSSADTEEEGVETDDEPTIRAHSSAGSETQSLCTVDNEDAYSEQEPGGYESEGHMPERGVTTSP